jgi:dephospho-CoA kinase
VPRPVAVAITGGIGAGKTAALEAFERHGAATVSSDEIVHELLRSDAEVRGALVGHFGEEIVGRDGEIDREAVAQRVFGHPDELAFLEGLLHPRVSTEYLRWREWLATVDPSPEVCVTEVPLLYEAGSQDSFDRVVLVTAPLGLRKARKAFDTTPREERLLPDKDKAKQADFVYVNDGSLDDLDRFVADVMETLRAERAE